VADDQLMVDSEAVMTASSPTTPGESASVEPLPQRRGRGKAPSQHALRTVGRETQQPETLKLDVSSSSVSPFEDHRNDIGQRRVIEASADNIVISFDNTNTTTVTPSSSVSQKPPKIGSGRLGKTESGSDRKPRGSRVKGQSRRSASAEEPVTIGIAVIRTPSDQPDVQYKPVDQQPKPKGILKQSRHEDWAEESVETLDWDKEIDEAQRRKLEMSGNEEESSVLTAGDHSDNKIAQEAGGCELAAAADDGIADDEDEWEDVEDDEDAHDISAESFDEFIREHTLKLDVALATPDVTEWTTKDPSGSITAGSQDSFLKTPVGQTRVVDWGAEMDQLSQSEKTRMSVEHGEFCVMMSSSL